MTPLASPETKGPAADTDGAIADMNYALEAYRQTNDLRLAEIENRLSADPLTQD
jgi:hypothetical protein